MRNNHADGPIHMTEDALKYRGEWVAFSGDFQRVVGHGIDPKEAQDMAEEANEEHAILFFIEETIETKMKRIEDFRHSHSVEDRVVSILMDCKIGSTGLYEETAREKAKAILKLEWK